MIGTYLVASAVLLTLVTIGTAIPPTKAANVITASLFAAVGTLGWTAVYAYFWL